MHGYAIMKTLREKYIAGLKLLGFTEIKCTHKFVVFNDGAGCNFYVGKTGSLRLGNNIATSCPASRLFKKALLNSLEAKSCIDADAQCSNRS